MTDEKQLHLFISTRHGDPWGAALAAALEQRGIDARTAEEAAEPGVDWAERIRAELLGTDALIVLVPPDGPPSTWQNTEAGAAMAFGKPVLVLSRDSTPSAAIADLRLQHMISASTPEEAAAKVEAMALGAA